MSSLPWNHCPASAGISVQLAPEFAERCTFRPVSAAGGARDWIPVFPGKMRKFLSIVTPWIAVQLVLCEVAGESSRQGLGVIKRLTSQERKWLDSISTQVFIRLIESDLTER